MKRGDAEVILVKRVGAAMTAVSLDGVTIAGTNPDLNDPLFSALKRLGYTVTDITSVSDADLAAVTDDEALMFLDLAELRLLETIVNQATSLVDISVGPRRESLSQLSDSLSKRHAKKEAQIYANYGDLFGMGLEAGSFSVASIEDGTNEY